MQNQQWIEKWLSVPRWQTYLHATNYDESLALALYEWNIELAQACMHDISHIEIAVRNSFARALDQATKENDHWLFSPNSPVRSPLMRTRNAKKIDLNTLNRNAIDEALSRLRTKNPRPDQVIPELSFGFWRHLTDAAHEKTLWIPYLHTACIQGTKRKDIDRSLALINRVRNRVAHHEPLFTNHRMRDTEQLCDTVQGLAERLIPQLAEYIRTTSTINTVIKNKPC